jgi:RNA polymerase sigma-70 factor (ECF subfamily)
VAILAALTTGDVQGLMDVLAPGVVMVADGGGLVPAFLQPIKGRERAVALLSRFSQVAPGATVATLLLNGAVAARIAPAGELHPVITFVVEDGRIARIYVIVNPNKLGRLEKVTELRR